MQDLLTLSDAVARHARLMPATQAARDSQRALNWAQWDDRATRLAAALLALGLGQGDRVGVLAYNRLEWLEIYVALARAGLVAVPLNFRLAGPELAYILEDAGATALIAGEEFLATVDGLREGQPAWAARCIALGGRAPEGWRAYEALLAGADSRRSMPEVQPDDMCALMYTSGTTGRPKGAVRTHAGSTLIAMATVQAMGFTPDDVALLVMPLCHANSLYFATTFIHLGAPCVIDDRRHFDPEAVLATLARERITFTSLVPTHYILMLALPPEVRARHDVGAVGRLMISSAPARLETKRAIMDFFPNGRLYELYGSTEAGWVTLLRPEEQFAKLGSVGREWPGSAAIRILDEQGREVPDGQVGELHSRTPYTFSAYWRNPQKTAEAFAGRWCSVGDMALRDADGYIWLVDRKSNMIISGGENVYPSEVENAVGAHPAVRDVAVVGLPHPKWGETVCAVAVLHPRQAMDLEALRAWCRERLAAFKCPTELRVIDEADMPRTATGKIQHRVLRERLLEGR